MSYLEHMSNEKGELSKGLWTPTIICSCGNRHEGDLPSVNINECEQCEGADMEQEMKKWRVRVSIPVEYDTSDLRSYFEATLDVEATTYDDAMALGVEEFNDNYDIDAIYDDLYDDLKSQMLVWLDGDYECDLTDEDYYFVEETKERKDND